MHLSDEMIAKLIDRNISTEEKDQYMTHLSVCGECFEIYSESLKDLEIPESSESFEPKFRILTRKTILIPFMAAAASIFAFLFVWNAVKTSPPVQQAAELVEIFVENGQQKELILADGTRVLLDSGSTFQYPEKFDGKVREVTLTGEGLFEVAPDRKSPFIVKARHALIRVVGTKFNIRAWDDSRDVKVAVAEGKVLLQNMSADPESAVLIPSGHLSILPAAGNASNPQKVDINQFLGWADRSIRFNNTPLLEILNQLERWYDIRFVPDKSIHVFDQLTIHIDNIPVEEILELIADLMTVEFRKDGRTVYLYSREEQDIN